MVTLKEMLEFKKWAVIGAREEKDTVGWKIPEKLKEHGYTVFMINPNYDTIDGEKVYSSLKDIKEEVDCVDILVNPNIVLNILEEIKEAKVKYVCFQPGTFNKSVKLKAEELGLKYTRGCVYAELSKKEM